jgi:hypothetical protein
MAPDRARFLPFSLITKIFFSALRAMVVRSGGGQELKFQSQEGQELSAAVACSFTSTHPQDEQ